MNGMDKEIETLDRILKIAALGYNRQEHTKLLASWCSQWDENPEYDSYITNEVELFATGNMLFLIPHADRKPIKLIIA